MIALTQNGKFKLEVQYEAATSHSLLVFTGALDESTVLSRVIPIVAGFGTKNVTFDLFNVTTFNSVGIGEWIRFIEKMQSQFECCFAVVSESMIEHANMIPHMLGKKGTRIQMIEAPYQCPKCRIRQMQLLKVDAIDLSSGQFVAPTFSCRCGNFLEFDALEEDFFSVLSHATQPASDQQNFK